MLNKDKILEDVTKDTITGGINNVVSYYMDDNVKDKNLLGATGMFISGATASGLSAGISGLMKKGAGIDGYVSPKKNSALPPTNLMLPMKQETTWEFFKRNSYEISRDSVIDATAGAAKTSIQYRLEATMQGREVKLGELDQKITENWIKDFGKSALKNGAKMSADEARNTRYGTLNTTLEKGSKLKNNISDKIDRSTGFFENVKDLNTIDIGRWNRLNDR